MRSHHVEMHSLLRLSIALLLLCLLRPWMSGADGQGEFTFGTASAVPNATAAHVTSLVRDMYERYPYPSGKPHATPIGRCYDLPAISQFIFGGYLKMGTNADFRILVAGCGTGDALVALSIQASAWAPNAEIVCMDLSQASLDIAYQRYTARVAKGHINQVNARFIRASLLDMRDLNLGTFDYIDALGVLHHLPDPQAGLTALEEVLKPTGGMGIMLYALYGRAGLYAIQSAARLIAESAGVPLQSESMVSTVEQMIDSVPDVHPLIASNMPHALDVTTIVDSFLHPQDRAYTVSDVLKFLESSKLRMTGFMYPHGYKPQLYKLHDSKWDMPFLKNMSWIQQAQLAEQMAGNMIKHTFFAVKQTNQVKVPRLLEDSSLVPFMRIRCNSSEASREVSALMKRDGKVAHSYQGHTFEFLLLAESDRVVGLCDGHHTIEEIRSETSRRTDVDTILTSFYDQGSMVLMREKLTLDGVLPFSELERTAWRKPGCSWTKHITGPLAMTGHTYNLPKENKEKKS